MRAIDVSRQYVSELASKFRGKWDRKQIQTLNEWSGIFGDHIVDPLSLEGNLSENCICKCLKKQLNPY